MGPLSYRRANRVGTAINPFQGSTFHQRRHSLRIQAHRHSNTRPLPHRGTPRARRRQISQIVPTVSLISPRQNLLITPCTHAGAAHEFSCAAPFCLSRNPSSRNPPPGIHHPESVRLPTLTSAAGPRRRTRSVCRRSSARPSPWPPSASGSTNGHRP